MAALMVACSVVHWVDQMDKSWAAQMAALMDVSTVAWRVATKVAVRVG